MTTPQPPKKAKVAKSTLHSYFSHTAPTTSVQAENPVPNEHEESSHVQNQISSSVIEIERDPGKRRKICDWPFQKRDEVRRLYLVAGPYQPKLQLYKGRQYKDKIRRFQPNWFNEFNWLEYSPTTHKAYCFMCFLFCDDVHASNTSALVHIGFDNWKRVHQGKACVFFLHTGTSAYSPHNKCVTCADSLMTPAQHIDKVIERVSKEEVLKNRLRLKTSIMTVQWLALQGCAFRGHDESEKSLNRGNMIELITYTAKWNEEVREVVLGNAPKNAKYTSPDIQKEILSLMANRVRRMIREEIGDSCFCLLVDEAKDESDREQMAIILRFVNVAGILTERFFAIKGVAETSSETLKHEICDVLSHYNLQVHKLRGQGYDGASNMRGQWNGLQALFLNDCPYAYYVHCFAHRLQLTLVASAKQCDPVWRFFSILDKVINIVKSSAKRNTELQATHRAEIDILLGSGERESGRGANQMSSLQRSGTTRWSSHYDSVLSMIELYNATYKVLENIACDGPNPKARNEADGACTSVKSFNFVFGLHVMKAIMAITDFLCQAFQKESVDILSAIGYVSTSKTLLQNLRDDGWDNLLKQVEEFCLKHSITIPDMKSKMRRGRSEMDLEHYYRFEYFTQSIDYQVAELNSRFSEKSVRLLELSVALDPSNSFESFNADHIYKLAVEFYPDDFEQHERNALMSELTYYHAHVVQNSQFEVPTLSRLCEMLVKTRKAEDFKMLTRLIRLVLTLPVSTATTERAFSAMKHVKTAIRNKMADEFLADSLTIFIERELVSTIDIDSLIDEFAKVKDRRVQLTF
ncbi:unnamed protein product [Cuscuta epithymum]|uniref:TTF-type domain-containing protein n=1 Tax=Cuscuta epithymum TaxID=186058 RepID=A0AAV0G214_9ASTE|nr:unnamed protein product [Cuscuta epithymum]